jgi:hypothetical protein
MNDSMSNSISEDSLGSRPSATSTVCWMLGLLAAFLSLSGSVPSEIASHGAYVVGGTLLIAVGLEVIRNWKAALRPDNIAFFILYYLTFFEFLFPQPTVNEVLNRTSVTYGCQLCLIAFGTMAIGRHWAPPVPLWLTSLVQRPSSAKSVLTIFWVSFFLAHLYMLLAVNFDVLTMVDRMMGPRFTQPWGRGRYGDWNALLNELGMIIILVPPLAGLILAKREKYGVAGYVPVILGVLFVFFEGLAGSTRSELGIYLVTFLVGFGLNLPKKSLIVLLAVGCLGLVGFYKATSVMLATRTIGLKEYLTNGETTPQLNDEQASFFVDLNLVNISQLTQTFPSAHPFLGWEVPYIGLIHPIPRAIWPGKPEGLSVSIESALGADSGSITLSTTFVGEAYMAGGIIGVVLAGLFFGIIGGWWGRLASDISSEVGYLIYVTGFGAIASMRSLFWLTTAALPTVAAVVLAMIFLRKRRDTFEQGVKATGQIAAGVD